MSKPAPSNFEFKPATRTGLKLVVGLFGESGTGKTLTALLLARGFAGPKGKIGIGDSEAGRGNLYAEDVPGGYIHVDITHPFRPQRYVELLHAAEEQKFDAFIFDSMSHEWEGIGGVLDWASENEEGGKKGQLIWKDPKMEHNKMVLAMMQSSIPLLIFCVRAKYKTRQKKVNGRTEILKDDYTTPIQAEDFIFEMTGHFEIMRDHTIVATKCPVKMRPCFPEDQKEPIGVKHGALLAEWAANPGPPGKAQKPAAPPAAAETAAGQLNAADTAKTAKKQLAALKHGLWAVGQAKFPDVKSMEQYLWDEGILSDTENLAELTPDRLVQVTEKLRANLA